MTPARLLRQKVKVCACGCQRTFTDESWARNRRFFTRACQEAMKRKHGKRRGTGI